MATFTDSQNNFTAGELGARLYAQSGLTAYRNSARTLENVLTWVQGGAYARNGTRYIAPVKTASEQVRLIPFQFSTTQTYVLEFGNLYMRVFKDQGQVESGGSPYEIATPYATADLAKLKFTQSADWMYITHPDYVPRKLARTDHTAWTITEAEFIDGPYLERAGLLGEELISDGTFASGSDILPFTDESTGTGVAEYSSSYNDTMRIEAVTGEGIAQGVFTVESGVAYILEWVNDAISGTMTVRAGTSAGGTGTLGATSITSTGKKSYRFVTSSTTLYVQFRVAGAGDSVNMDKVSLRRENAALLIDGPADGDYLVGEEATVTATGGTPFTADHVGSSWRLREPANTSDPEWMWMIVTEYTSPTEVQVLIKSDAPDNLDNGTNTPTTFYREGAWSAHRGYPAAVTMYEQRLMLAGTAHQPQTIWGSVSGDFERFSPAGTVEEEDSTGDLILADGTIADDHSLDYTAATSDVVSVLWMQDNGDVLLVGTNGGLLTMSGSSLGDGLTPSSVRVRRNNNTRSADIQPVQLNSDIFFLEDGGRKLHLLSRDTEFDRYKSDDVTLFSHHILGTGVTEMASMQRPTPSIWCVRADGQLATFTYHPQQSVAGWQRQVIAGTDAAVESVAIIPSTTSTYSDEVWLSVKRTIDGGTVRYIEMLLLQNWSEEATEDFFYVDSGLTYDGSSATVISGLDHLEGEEVAILADGFVQNSKTVASGSITLDTAASVVQVGLAYTPKIETLRANMSAVIKNESHGKRRSIHGLNILLHDSIGGTYGPDAATQDALPLWGVEDDVSAPPSLFSGFRPVEVQSRNDTEGYLTITQDKPYPFAVLALYPDYSIKKD